MVRLPYEADSLISYAVANGSAFSTLINGRPGGSHGPRRVT